MLRSTYSSWIVGLAILWSIAGFPFVAGLSALTGSDNSAISLATRAFVAFLAGLLIIVPKRGPPDIALTLFGFFWLAYSLRLLVSLHLLNQTGPLNGGRSSRLSDILIRAN